MIFAFAGCELDVARRELRREGAVVHVEPQVFDVLSYLVRHRDRVVSKDELYEAVWNGRIVSEATLTSRISAARRAIGDSGEQQAYLRTIARHGFRFCGEIDTPSLDAERPTNNLPARLTRLFGREGDTAQLVVLLRGSRLVTLTGPGGVGKTRLAIENAAAIMPEHPDGVWLIEFAALSDAAAVAHAVAGTLGVSQRGDRSITQSVLDALRGRHLLLLLDNCEHLIDAIAALARQILANCPHVTLLATSREALALDGERVFPVAPLDVEGTTPAANALFVDRACAVAPQFLTEHDDPAVAEICRRLDGIPLAIELAAARMNALSPSQLRDRLDERFRVLGRGSRGAAERHQTLRGATQWSFDLLTSTERTVLLRASFFAGGFMLEAAEQICGGDGVLDALDSLVRKSLLTVQHAGGVARYGMLETIRQFAGEQHDAITERDELRLRHARYFADDADKHFAIWLSPRQLEAYHWLDRELPNLRSAFRWAVEHAEIDIAARIASDIGDMARFRVRGEAALWASEIVEAARAVQHRRLPLLLTWAASSAWSFARLDEARRHASEAIALANTAGFGAFAWAFADLAMVASYEGKHEEVIALAHAGARQPSDRRDRFCLAMRPYFLSVAGRHADAIAAASEDLAIVETAGVPASIAIALWASGKALAATDAAAAVAAFNRGFAVAGESGNRFWETMIIFEIAALQARVGDAASALRSFESVLSLGRHSADLMFVSHGFGNLIVLFDRLGLMIPAAMLSGTLSRTFEFNPFVPDLADALVRVRDQLGGAKFDAASRQGAAMALHEAYDYAVDEVRGALALSPDLPVAPRPGPGERTGEYQ